MMKSMKRLMALALALLLCLSFAGCYSQDKTWAAKMGNDTMPIGAYIYYLSSAYTEAGNKISTDAEVLKGEVDGQPAQEWIEDRAMAYLYADYYLIDKLQELDLSLTDEELEQADEITNGTWSYYQTTFESMGISKDSFHRAYSLYSLRYQKLMKALYGEGGEMAVPQEELETFFNDNYYAYEYFTVSLNTTDEDGNSVAMDEEQEEDLRQELETYAKQITDGSITLGEAATEYGYVSGTTPTPSGEVHSEKETISDTLGDALAEMDEGETSVVDGGSTLYLLHKLPMDEAFQGILEDEDETVSLIADIKGDEYADYVMEQGQNLEGVELNQRAIDSVSLNAIINDSNRNGASSTAEEEESSSSDSEEESSGEESSAEESSSSEEAE